MSFQNCVSSVRKGCWRGVVTITLATVSMLDVFAAAHVVSMYIIISMVTRLYLHYIDYLLSPFCEVV